MYYAANCTTFIATSIHQGACMCEPAVELPRHLNPQPERCHSFLQPYPLGHKSMIHHTLNAISTSHEALDQFSKAHTKHITR